VFSANDGDHHGHGNPSHPAGVRPRAPRRQARPGHGGERSRHRTHDRVSEARDGAGGGGSAQKILDAAPAGLPTNVPGTVDAVKEGRASAGIVYYPPRWPRSDVDIVRFSQSVNERVDPQRGDRPGTARNASEALAFVRFLLSSEAQAILRDTGQPPVVALRKGAVPPVSTELLVGGADCASRSCSIHSVQSTGPTRSAS
jgi:hypothetical protein